MMLQEYFIVTGHPSEETITFSVGTNGVKNGTIYRRNTLLAKEIIGPRNHAIKDIFSL